MDNPDIDIDYILRQLDCHYIDLSFMDENEVKFITFLVHKYVHDNLTELKSKLGVYDNRLAKLIEDIEANNEADSIN